MKIFVIDDEEASLYFLTKAIKEVKPSDKLMQFNNHVDFMNEFKKEMPDVAFLDVDMPEVNGIELAKKIIKIKKDVNIIFVTAFREYAIDAFDLNANGYIVKPANKDKIAKVLNNLRYPITDETDLKIKTFGNFDLFFKGEPVKFRSTKSKEILAYLVDREGALVSKKELGGVIYEDDYSRSTQAILSRNIQYLNEDLINLGINNFFIIDKGNYYVDLKNVDCDLIKYINGNHSLFNGEYLEQYSWAEYRKMNF